MGSRRPSVGPAGHTQPSRRVQGALGLLHRLNMPADTGHLHLLCSVLAAGCQNHHTNPDACVAAQASSGADGQDQ
jgi:hypothetical protein